jgi:hypothetical protein
MEWESNLILMSSNQEELRNALEQILGQYSEKRKILYSNYNNGSATHFGKHIRERVTNLDKTTHEFESYLKGLEYGVENKKLLISKIDDAFNELEQLNQFILDELSGHKAMPANSDESGQNISSQIFQIQLELKKLSKKGQELNNELYLSFEEKMKRLMNDLNDTVKNGLNEIAGFKNELELGKNYREMIEMQLLNSKKNVTVYLIAFVCSLLLLAGVLVAPSFVVDRKDLYIQISLRLSIGLPLIWLVSFVFTHYKFYKVAQIKYQHILNLLGGGAYYIGALLEDKTIKEKANNRIIDLLLDYKDLSNLFYREKAPMDKYIKNAMEILKETKGILSDNPANKKVKL